MLAKVTDNQVLDKIGNVIEGLFTRQERASIMENQYDVIVIGAGNGGLAAAATSAKIGL